MNAICTFRRVIVRVCAVCIGALVVDAAYSKGKHDAYKECLNIVNEGIAELENVENKEGEAQ